MRFLCIALMSNSMAQISLIHGSTSTSVLPITRHSFFSLTGLQITDVTHFLPARQQASLAASDEVLECFIVHQVEESHFIKASRSINSEPNVVRILVEGYNNIQP
jgi:hypothetical protein